MKMLKSFLRHLLGAVLSAAGVILSTPADISLKAALVTIGAAVVPVLVKAVDPGEPDYGVGRSDSGEADIALLLLVATFVGVVLLLFGVHFGSK